jgi:hypothetical protein
MPYKIKKVSNKKCYKLYNKNTKKVFSKCSTLKNVKKQLRLLNAIKYNKSFIVKRKTRSIAT